MQSLAFTRALTDITSALKVRELLSILDEWFNNFSQQRGIADAQKDLFAKLVMESNAGYARLLQQPNTRSILERLDIGKVYEPSRVRQMMSALSVIQHTNQIPGQAQVFFHFATFRELLQNIATFQSGTVELLQQEKLGQVNPSDGIVELEVIQYADEDGYSPKRIQALCSSMLELHSHVARICGIQSDIITFKYLDSGSGVLLGFKCAKEVADALNALLAQWWDKWVYWRYESFDKKVAAVSKGLALIDVIHQSAEKGTITKEDAENLKLRVLREVDNLTQLGVTAPLTSAATIDQRQLLTEVRNTKLLSDGASTKEEAGKAD